MSAKVVEKVWAHFPARNSGELACALFIARAASDDGALPNAALSVAAALTRQDARAVESQVRRFVAIGWLERRSRHSREFRISPAWLADPELFLNNATGDSRMAVCSTASTSRAAVVNLEDHRVATR